MKNIKLSISQKLYAGFIATGLIIAILGVFSVYFINLIKEEGYDVGAHKAPLGDAAMEIKLSAANAHILVEEVIDNPNEKKEQEAWEYLDETLWYCDAILTGGVNDEGEFFPSENPLVRKKIETVKIQVNDFIKIAKKRINPDKNATDKEITQTEKKFDKEFKTFTLLADEAEELIHDEMEEGVRNFVSNSNKAKNIIIFISITIIILSLVIAFIISKSVSNLISKTVGFAQNVAKGNYNANLEIDRNDEMGKLANALRTMVDSFKKGVDYAQKISKGNLIPENINSNELNPLEESLITMEAKLIEVLKNIAKITNQITTGSNEISSSAEQIAAGANEQAASTEEVSASMEEMVANINQNTENAVATEKISIKASEGITEGNKSFNITISAMKEIAEKISVIGEIAQKTDVLAINAAIEAARAGEQGKGFAVVANEIRKLAENSQNAANEIDSLVASSVKIAEESEKLLTEITPEIKKTAILVKEISNAGNEQNSGANQINDAIQELTKVIQQNTLDADEMASGSKYMSLQAEQLKQSVSFFNIGKIDEIKTTNFDNKLNKTEQEHALMSNDSNNGASIILENKGDDDDFEQY